MAVNADEGEPGTFKDRYFLETDPHRFLEGMLIAAWVVEAAEVYIYLRDEYPQCRAILESEIAAIEAAGLAPHTRIHLRRGAGAYICGEESAMLESIEGKRGLPRQKPPFPAQVGLFGRPTLINNVETLYWVRDIVEKGAGLVHRPGPQRPQGAAHLLGLGPGREPGVKLAPAGITARELIDEYCGGMAEGHAFKGYLPGGASGGILPAAMADIPLDFGTLEAEGCFIGSAAVVVLSDKDDMRAVALNLLRFFEDESCGQCTPCRAGTEKAVKLMTRAALGRAAAAGTDAGHERRLDLRPGPGGDEPGQAGAEAFPRGSDVMLTQRSPRHSRRRRGSRSSAPTAVEAWAPASRGGDGYMERLAMTEPIRFFLDGAEVRPSRARRSGRSPTGRASRSRISAGCRSPAIAPTAIAAPAWSRSRASGCSPPPACASRPRA